MNKEEMREKIRKLLEGFYKSLMTTDMSVTPPQHAYENYTIFLHSLFNENLDKLKSENKALKCEIKKFREENNNE